MIQKNQDVIFSHLIIISKVLFLNQLVKMESIECLRKYENESHILVTLNKQIQSLSPLRISYENLSRYHQKILRDLQSLIQQHDYAITSLKSNSQNLSVISMRTEGQRNDLIAQFKDCQNQQAKLILDTRNIAQKYQSLTQKLELQKSRTEQNINYRTQLESILTTLKVHIENTERLNTQLENQSVSLVTQSNSINSLINLQTNKKAVLQQSNDSLKCSIAKVNIKNDDMIDGNRKLSEEIRYKQEEIMSRNKQTRKLKQQLIQLKSQFEKVKNQIDYKITLISNENTVQLQLTAHEEKLLQIVDDENQQKVRVQQENLMLMRELQRMEAIKNQSIQFKLKSENHLAELKQSNELLLNKMEQCCIQDRQIQTLLIKKMSTLQLFSKRLNQRYQQQQTKRVEGGRSEANRAESVFKDKYLFRENSLNLEQLTLFKIKSSITQNQNSQMKKSTRASDKSWLKQNYV